MAILKTDAIVLRTIDHSETSLIVWLFTREHGRVHVIAKGARRPRSPFEGALEPLVRGELLFYRKAARLDGGLDTAKEFDPQELHFGLREDLRRLYRGVYVGELLTALSEHELPAPDAFAAAATALAALSKDELPALDRRVIDFELALLRASGLAPVLDRCARCGGPVFAGGEDDAWFGPDQGGAVCRQHGPPPIADTTTIAVTRPLLRALLTIALGRPLALTTAITRDLRRLLDAYITWHVGKPLRAARHLQPIDPAPAPRVRARS